jgi:hypothetical protein
MIIINFIFIEAVTKYLFCLFIFQTKNDQISARHPRIGPSGSLSNFCKLARLTLKQLKGIFKET